jgi:hypothetical protein
MDTDVAFSYLASCVTVNVRAKYLLGSLASLRWCDDH